MAEQAPSLAEDLTEEELKSFILATGTDGGVYLIHLPCSLGNKLPNEADGGPPNLNSTLDAALRHACHVCTGAK